MGKKYIKKKYLVNVSATTGAFVKDYFKSDIMGKDNKKDKNRLYFLKRKFKCTEECHP